MVADGLTKALGPERHKRLTAKMGMDVWNDKGSDGKITTMRSGSVGSVSPVALGENGGSKPIGENGGIKPTGNGGDHPGTEEIIPSETTGKGSPTEKAKPTVKLGPSGTTGRTYPSGIASPDDPKGNGIAASGNDALNSFI